MTVTCVLCPSHPPPNLQRPVPCITRVLQSRTAVNVTMSVRCRLPFFIATTADLAATIHLVSGVSCAAYQAVTVLPSSTQAHTHSPATASLPTINASMHWSSCFAHAPPPLHTRPTVGQLTEDEPGDDARNSKLKMVIKNDQANAIDVFMDFTIRDDTGPNFFVPVGEMHQEIAAGCVFLFPCL